MKFFPAILVLAVAACSFNSFAHAQDQPSLRARIAVRRELELAKMDLRNYWQVDYPRQRRELDAAIEITEAEIRANCEAQQELRPFTRFSLGEPFPLTIQDLQMCRKAAEVRLKNLQVERNALIRFHSDQFRVLEMKVMDARLRLVELEANDVMTSEPAAN